MSEPVPSIAGALDAASESALRQWRADTPGCVERLHLNNAGAALMPRPVLDAHRRALRLEGAMGGYEAADARAADVAAAYEAVGRLVGRHARNIAFIASATAAFVQAMSARSTCSRRRDRDDAAPTTRRIRSSSSSLARRLGVRIVHAEDVPEGGVDPQSVREILGRRRCRLGRTCRGSPRISGLVQDVEAVGEVCEALGVPYLVDACQAVGQVPIDVATSSATT